MVAVRASKRQISLDWWISITISSGEGEHPRPGQQDQELVAEVPLPAVKASRVYAKIVGRDVHAGEGEHPRPGQQDQELVAEVPLPGVKAPRVYAKIVGRDVHAAGEGEHPRPGQQDQELVAEVPLPAVKAPRVYAKIVGRDVHAAGEGEHPRPGQQDQELVAEVPLPGVKASRVYAKIVGRDVHAGEGEHPRPGQQDQELVAEVPLPAVKASRVYAKIVGRDVHAAGEGEHPRPGQQDQELVAEVPLPAVKAPRVYAKIVGRDVHVRVLSTIYVPYSYAMRTNDWWISITISSGEGEHPRPGQQDQELVAEVPLPAVKASRVYAKIVGRDVHGESFVRLSGPLHQASEIRTGRSATVVFPDAFSELEMAEEYSQRGQRQMQYNETGLGGRTTSQVVNQLGTLMTTVQIGLSSRLYGAPGEIFAIHYEVTNYRDQGVQFSFGAGDELSYLLDVKPRYQYVASGQSVVVIVRMIISNAATPGARDLVIFTAEGRDKASIAAYVYVTSPDGPPTDLWAPEVTHSFQGSCFGKMRDDCAQNVWSVNVVARDNVAGLLRVSSSPPGLLYAGNFVAGTRDSVVSTYRASCCAPRLLVTAVDAVGNAQSYNLDISNYFTPASIAAIVLGVFLLIALILIVAFLIYWCVRRRRESKELPYTARREIG
ncbi:hypothetical protein JYU34_007980 [Plutella xylostella]|uniref:Uncharacterized protein n=1 Tax=Plutella xylostella TaxID=51655 RepID=A0ABQ7QNI8_PLUXY|nr:hypothetical protein JYU34_007980 [Plutella xylostella]